MYNFDTLVVCCTFCTLLVLLMWFGHLFKVFRSVSLDLTGYVASMVHLKLVNLFVEKQVMLPATLPDIESEILVVKIYFAKVT